MSTATKSHAVAILLTICAAAVLAVGCAQGLTESAHTAGDSEERAKANRVVEHDADGRPTFEGFDREGDGTFDTLIHFSYDADGTVTKSLDRNADGIPERITIISYDADGNKVSEAVDRDADGDIDGMTTFAYTADGKVQNKELDHDHNGTVDRRRTYSYDPHTGQLAREVVDQNADRFPERETRYLRDDAGELLSRVVTHTSVDGSSARRVHYHYDPAGRLMAREVEENSSVTSLSESVATVEKPAQVETSDQKRSPFMTGFVRGLVNLDVPAAAPTESAAPAASAE